MKCYFCDREEADMQAIESGWVPSFYFTGDPDETMWPVCPECAAEHLEADESGELACVTD